MKNAGPRLPFRLAALAAMLSLAAVTPAAFADGSRAPLQDTFVRYDQTGAAFGTETGITVGNGREGCMMFDVSGLAAVDSAKIRFRVTQCGTAAGVVWPLYFRVMRNDRWNETSLTWNSLPDEFRVGPSPVLATNDTSVAGYIEIPAGSTDTWQEVDVTEAVKAAAQQGRLALHVYTSWDDTSGDTTPLAFASSELRGRDAAPSPTVHGRRQCVGIHAHDCRFGGHPCPKWPGKCEFRFRGRCRLG